MKQRPITILGSFIWLLAALFFLYEFFLRTFLGSLADQILSSDHLNAETFALLATAYYITYAIVQIPVGILLDTYGVKKVLTPAALIAAASVIHFSYADGFYSAFAARVLMGFGSAFAFIALLVVTYEWFPKRIFAFMIGLSQFVGTMGPMLAGGPLVSFMQSATGTWRDTIFAIGVFGLVLAALILLFVRNNKNPFGPRHLREISIPKPTKDKLKRLAANKQAWLTASFSALMYASLAIFGVEWGTKYLQTRGLTQSHAAYTVTILWVGYALGCPILGALSDKFKRRVSLMRVGSFLGVAGISIIAWVPISSYWLFAIAYFFVGVAASSSSVAFAAISEKVSSDIKASALGLNNAFIMMAGGLISPVIGAMIWFSAKGQSHYTSHDFTSTMVMLTGFYVAAFIISKFFIAETYAKPQKDWTILDARLG